MESTIHSYLRRHASELGARILEMYPPLQAASDPTPESLKELLRSPLPAQAVAIGSLAKYLETAKAARIVGECGTGKTYMALALAHVLAAGRPYTALVMCPSHIAKKWARETLKTIPLARTFLIEDMRNGGELWMKLLPVLSKDLATALESAVKSSEPLLTAIKQYFAEGKSIEGVQVKRLFHLRIG